MGKEQIEGFVRHGKTQWNLEYRIQGSTPHIPLLESSKDETRALGRKLKQRGFVFSTVYTSEYLRTIETGEILQEELGIADLVKVAGFNERSAGDMEGRTFSEVRALGHEDYGEPKTELRARVAAAYSEIKAKENGANILIVSHSAVMKVLLPLAGFYLVSAPHNTFFYISKGELSKVQLSLNSLA
ncbi:MAG: histidine phosphatase family protein [Candidatus Levyibacteriota bacterium]